VWRKLQVIDYVRRAKNDPARTALLRSTDAGWRRCMNYPRIAAIGLRMTYRRVGTARRLDTVVL
jgi:hypothetical protein